MKSQTRNQAEIQTCPCSFPNKETERKARADFLRDYGDELPKEIIEGMVGDKFWDNWFTRCTCSEKNKIIAAVHYEENDWYLCTLKGLAVRKEARGHGLGTSTVKGVVEKASVDEQCKVLAADVTFDNLPSIKSISSAGFETVGEFCWEKGQKPADILHFIRFKPTQNKTCLKP